MSKLVLEPSKLAMVSREAAEGRSRGSRQRGTSMPGALAGHSLRRQNFRDFQGARRWSQTPTKVHMR